jgi:Zn-dependent peptidase ImmA (M78 family)
MYPALKRCHHEPDFNSEVGAMSLPISYICSETARLVRKYDEHDPVRLAREMGVIVTFEPMGKDDRDCKGFFIYQSRKKIIVINSDLPDQIQRIIAAHELGHSVFHARDARQAGFHDFALYSASSQYEYEANLFAAEFLLDDAEVVERLSEDTFFFYAARDLMVPPELLDFKFRILKAKGLQIEPPLMARSDFLKNITRTVSTPSL